MEDTHAGGTAGILEDALALAGAGRLDNAARARLWALVAEAVIAGGTAHALVEIDVQARGRAGKPGNGGPAAPKAAKREEIRLAWANSVPWSIRGRIDLPLATWAVFGMLIARAGCPGGCPGGEWRAELSLTEMQRRLGGAGRKTVTGAVARLERAGFVRAIRRRRNPRFSEVNIYILEHPEAARAAARETWREEEAVQVASEAPEGFGASPGSSPASNSSPKETHKNLIEDSTTKIHVNEPAQTNPPIPHSPSQPRTRNLPSCSSLQDRKKPNPCPSTANTGARTASGAPAGGSGMVPCTGRSGRTRGMRERRPLADGGDPAQEPDDRVPSHGLGSRPGPPRAPGGAGGHRNGTDRAPAGRDRGPYPLGTRLSRRHSQAQTPGLPARDHSPTPRRGQSRQGRGRQRCRQGETGEWTVSGGRRPVRRPAPPPLSPPLRRLLLESYEPTPLLRAAGGPARACQYIGDAKGNARDWAVCGKRSVAGKKSYERMVGRCC